MPPLTDRSALLHWSAADLVPARGGRIAASRSTSGRYHDQAGELVRALPDGLRLEWFDAGPRGRVPGVLLEPLRTNRLPYSEDFTQWSKSASITLTPGQRDPAGGTGAFLATDDGTADGQLIAVSNLTGLASGANCGSIYMRRGTAARSYVGLLDATLSVWRYLLLIHWGDLPLVSQADGAGEAFAPEEMADELWRFAFRANDVVSGNNNGFYIYPSAQTPAGGSVTIFGADAEPGAYPTAYKPTSGAVASRNYDQFRFQQPVPQPSAAGLAIYAHWRAAYANTVPAIAERIWQLGTGAAPLLTLYAPAPQLHVYLHNGTTDVAAGFTLPYVRGDRIEAVVLMDGGAHVQLIARVNGGPAAASGWSAAPSGGMPATWSAQLMWLNSEGTNNIGAGTYESIRVAPYADLAGTTAETIMAEMAAWVRRPSWRIAA